MSEPLPQVLTAVEVAEALRVSKATVYRWHAEKKLPGFRVGQTLRFRRSDVLAFMGAAA